MINSSSKKASFLMGLLTLQMINSDKEFTYKELICINALGEFFDYDIDNLDQISQSVKRKYFSINPMFIRHKKLNENSINLTIEKCVANQILCRTMETDLDIDNSDISFSSADICETFSFTEPGILLREELKYIEDI